MHIASVRFKYFSCFIRMLLVFYLDIAYVLQWLQTCFIGVSDVYCKCFNCFGLMLQVFYLNVTKVDLGATHVAVGPICSMQLLHVEPACMHVGVEGRHGASVRHKGRVWFWARSRLASLCLDGASTEALTQAGEPFWLSCTS
jgi:hypothetical protein